MKPVAIFRHSPTEGPGYFASFLDRHSIPWQLICLDAGQAVPQQSTDYSGLCFLGGAMSVNDPLPWIEPVLALIRTAVANGVPVIGHCLGGQLMSKALGGQVSRNSVKEIGWAELTPEDSTEAHRWLNGNSGPVTVFQWHGETFSIPPGATRILTNSACANQVFVLGPHLGMQCHIEITPEMIGIWSASWQEEIDDPHCPLPTSIQSVARIAEETDFRLPMMRRLSDRLYSVWTAGLRRE